MNDVIVTVRMPRSLLERLKEISSSNHYMDVSETVRSIVRRKWTLQAKPELARLEKLKEDISAIIKEKSMTRVTLEVNKELEKIRDQLKGEGFLP